MVTKTASRYKEPRSANRPRAQDRRPPLDINTNIYGEYSVILKRKGYSIERIMEELKSSREDVTRWLNNSRS